MMMGATPAKFTYSGCTTPMAMPAATPASMALPPASRILKPASAARYWHAATMWRVPMMVGRWACMFPPWGIRYTMDNMLRRVMFWAPPHGDLAMALAKTGICDFGRKAHDFALAGVDGKTYSLADVRARNGMLVVFICNHCPYVRAVIGRLVAEAKALGEIGIGT